MTSRKKTRTSATRTTTPISGGSIRGTQPGVTTTKQGTFTPGQSVEPGTTSIPGYPGYWTNSMGPSNKWWPIAEGMNALPLLWQLLTSSNNGANLTQQYSDLLSQLIKMADDGNAALNPDLLISLFQNFLQYQTTQEQRSYDYGMLNESRQYNNPQNELARLMGAGISRDAAIQILSGSAGNSSVVGSGAASAIQSPVAGAGAASLNGSNAQAVSINSALNIIQMVANLFNQGVDMYSSIQSAQMLTAQNYMTQQQLSAFQTTNQITQQIQNLVTNGIIEPADVDSWKDSNDVYKWLLDHADTNGVKPLFDNGSVQGVFGTTLGRKMFNEHWQQMRESKDAGKVYSSFVRQQELQADIQQMNLNQSYLDLQTTFADLQMKKPQLYDAYVNLLRDLQQYDTEGFTQQIVKTQAYQADIDERILRRVYESASNGGIGSSDSSGIEMLSFSEWYSLKQACIQSQVNFDHGDEYWQKFFRSNVKTAATLQFLKEHQVELMDAAMNPDGPNPGFATILNIIKMMTDAGAWKPIEMVLTPFRASGDNTSNYYITPGKQ